MEYTAPLVVGLIAGGLGRLFIPGMGPAGFVVTITLGLSGAIFAAFLGVWLNWFIDLGGGLAVTVEALGAILLLVIYRGLLALRPRRQGREM